MGKVARTLTSKEVQCLTKTTAVGGVSGLTLRIRHLRLANKPASRQTRISSKIDVPRAVRLIADGNQALTSRDSQGRPRIKR